MSTSLAIDLGAARTVVFEPGRGVVIDWPTVAAVEMPTGRLLAYGETAREMIGRAAGPVSVVRPVRHGQLQDLDLTDQIAAYLLRVLRSTGAIRPEVLCCVSGLATGMQRRALERSFKGAGARRVGFLDSAVACGIAARIGIEEPVASMVVDIGAASSDIAVIAIGGIVTSGGIPLGGGDFDEEIRQLCIRSFDLLIDLETAEEVKRSIGSAWPSEEKKAEVTGRDLDSGRPRSIVLSSSEVASCLGRPVDAIVDATVRCITKSPPDLANDLLRRGLHLAGGGGLLDGFARRLATATGIPVHLVNDPIGAAAAGGASYLRSDASPSQCVTESRRWG
jgi:rod shape-determining protein MreB